MQTPYVRQLRRMLPPLMPFTYIPDRESAWRLYHGLDQPMRLADLRRSPLAPFLTRPGVAPAIAACGDGILRREELAPLAHPERALTADLPLSPAGERMLLERIDGDWRDYQLSLTQWASPRMRNRADAQTSLPEANLVVQLNFPASHQTAFWQAVHRAGKTIRNQVEYRGHPIRTDGIITAAWARLESEPWGEDILIEELQSDWFRRVLRIQNQAEHLQVRDRALLDHYVRHVMPVYHREWARVLLLAVLEFCRRELGARRIWLHQFPLYLI